MRRLNEQEKEMIWVALGMRTNYIETNDIATSAMDIQNIGVHSLDGHRNINALSDDQMRLILASRELVTKVLQNKLFIED